MIAGYMVLMEISNDLFLLREGYHKEKE